MKSSNSVFDKAQRFLVRTRMFEFLLLEMNFIGEALEFLSSNEKRFNVLILSHILEHLDNPKEFLMKFNGYFQCIYIEVPDFDRYYLNHYRKDLGLKLIYSDDDHVSEFDRDELKIILTECRIEITKEEYKHGVQRLWCRGN